MIFSKSYLKFTTLYGRSHYYCFRVVDIGTDMLEIDCQITEDRKVVVAHDNNLLRLTGVDKDISTLRYDELPILKESLPVDFEPGIISFTNWVYRFHGPDIYIFFNT